MVTRMMLLLAVRQCRSMSPSPLNMFGHDWPHTHPGDSYVVPLWVVYHDSNPSGSIGHNQKQLHRSLQDDSSFETFPFCMQVSKELPADVHSQYMENAAYLEDADAHAVYPTSIYRQRVSADFET